MSHSPDADAEGSITPRPPQFHSSPAPSPANAAPAGSITTEAHAKSPTGNTLRLPTQRFGEHATEQPEHRAAGGESPHVSAGDDEPKDASAIAVAWTTESQRKTSSSDDSTSSPPIGSPATPLRVISASQSRRSTLKNFDAFKSVLQAQQKSADATDGSDASSSGGAAATASNLEADLQLAGQIGEALLSENGKLETLVDELTTTLQEEYEAKQAVLEENEELRAQLEELSKLHAEMSSNNAFNSFSPVAAGSPSATTISRSPAGSRPHRLDTRTGGGDESSIGLTLNELTGTAEDAGQEELLNGLVAFLRSELGPQSNLARVTPGSTTNSGSVMIGMAELRMNSPPAQHNLTSPSQHDRMFTAGFGGIVNSSNGGGAGMSRSSSSTSTFSTSPAAPLNPSLLLEDLNAVLRKLRKERRVADLEKSSCAAQIAAMEKEVSSAKAWVAEHQSEVDSAAALRDQIASLQKALELSQSQAKEDAATASVEAKLKLQQAKRHLESSMKQLEEELRLDRAEAAALLAQRNELARRSNTLEQQLLQDQEALRQAQLEAQTLKHSHAQLASLTSQLRDELERSLSEAEAQIQARDAQIAALSSSTSQGSQELLDLRRELSRAETELAASTQAHIAQLASISAGFDRKLEAEVSRAVAAAEKRAAETLLHREAELLAAQDAALLVQRSSIEAQLESQRLETEQAIAEQTAAFLEKHKQSLFSSNEEPMQVTQGREEIVLALVDLSSPDTSAAALQKKELEQSSELPSGLAPMGIQVKSLVSPHSASSGTSSASDDGSFLSPISTFATSGSPPSTASASSVFSPAGSSCASNRSSATPVHFNLSLKHLQLKFPVTPSTAAAAVSAAASSSTKPIVAPLSAPARGPPVQCCSETQTSPLPAANDSQITFSVDAPVSTQATPSVSVLSPEPASSNHNNRGSSPASRARLMESPMPGQQVGAGAMSSSQSFVAASPNKTNRHFHAMHSSVAASLSAAGALPPRSPAQPVRAGVQQQAVETATQHRLALLSSVGKALSVVTGSSPVNTRVGNTPPAPIGRSPLTTSTASPSAPNVAAALSTAMTPKSSAAAKVSAAATNAASGVSHSIYVLPLPPFAVSPSDQLALAYLYRYLHATWVQSFSWLQSSPSKERALWIRDEMAGHCFSCQKHWTITSRRHHCRLCGGLFCATCSRFRLELPHSDPDSSLVRCCLRCFGAQQSMTMSNSLSLWEQTGTLEPPPERTWIGSSFVLGSPAAKVQAVLGRRGSSNASVMAPHSDAILPASAETSTRLGSHAGEAHSSDDDSDEVDDSSDEFDSTDEDEDHERHGTVLDDEHAQSKNRRSKRTAAQAVVPLAVEQTPA